MALMFSFRCAICAGKIELSFLMYYSSEMEWNPKWGWENLDYFNSKESESLKKLHLADWEIEDEGEIEAGSLKLSGSGHGSRRGGSDSDLINGYSMKSSISASTDSSPYEGNVRVSRFTLEPYASSPGTMLSGNDQSMPDASALANSLVSAEPLIGLKLGKRTYFENSGNVNSPASVIPGSSFSAVLKKTRSSSQNAAIPRCQVQGCNLDLSSAKDYHRKHRVCDNHSKSPKVVVGGVELRFCQQCSRFHGLSEFDEKKRSCRRRLSDHNARRRKPKQEALQFHSNLSTPFYDGMQRMNFGMDSGAGGFTLENMHSPKFTLEKCFPWRIEKAGQPSMQSIDLLEDKGMPSSSSSRFSAFMKNPAQVFTQGSKEAMLPSYSSAAPDFPRALSLLSKSWGSTEADCVLPDRFLQANPVSSPLSPMCAIPQGIPLASSDYWQVQHQSNNLQFNDFSEYCNTGSHSAQVKHLSSQDHGDFTAID